LRVINIRFIGSKNKRASIVYSGPILNSMIYYYLLLTVLEKFYTIIFKWAFNQF